MLNSQIMNANTLKRYNKITDAIKSLRTVHGQLIKKAKAKKLDAAGRAKLKVVITLHNKLEKIRKEIWDAHSLVNIVLRDLNKK